MIQEEPITIVLSREEVLLALQLLQAEGLPGLDEDPSGVLPAEQMALALFVASRGLRARRLAQLDEGEQLQLHSTLLTAVGVCAYAQNTLFAYHWPDDGQPVMRYFAHLRDNHIVVHTRPEDVLHQFDLLPSREDLLAQVLAFCQYATNGSASHNPMWEMTLSATEFVQVREWAEKGQTETAVAHLTALQITPEAAQSFVAALGMNRRVTVFQTLKQQTAAIVNKRDFTLVQEPTQAWLILPATNGEPTKLHIKTTDQTELVSLLDDSI